MRIYAVSGNRSTNATYRSSWVFHQFLHGRVRGPSNLLGRKPYKQLPLERNLQLMPAVTFPTGKLVVNKSVMEQLISFPHIESVPCLWDKVYDYPVDEASVNDLLQRLSALNDDLENYVSAISAKPEREVAALPYFEVLAPSQKKLADQYVCGASFILPDSILPSTQSTDLLTCAEIHEHYPMTRLGGYRVCNEEAYAVLQPHVQDTEQFTVIPLDVLETH